MKKQQSVRGLLAYMFLFLFVTLTGWLLISFIGHHNYTNQVLARYHLQRGHLIGAKMAGLDLRLVDLRNEDLSGADLTGANLSGAQMDGANLKHAKLVGIIMDIARNDGKWVRPSLKGANLGWANMSRAKLFGADLTGANLERTKLENAYMDAAVKKTEGNIAVYITNLSNTVMICANLQNAELGARLDGALMNESDLRGAKIGGGVDNTDLRKADLRGANLKYAYPLDEAQLKDAIYDKTTIWPGDYRPKDHGLHIMNK